MPSQSELSQLPEEIANEVASFDNLAGLLLVEGVRLEAVETLLRQVSKTIVSRLNEGLSEENLNDNVGFWLKTKIDDICLYLNNKLIGKGHNGLADIKFAMVPIANSEADTSLPEWVFIISAHRRAEDHNILRHFVGTYKTTSQINPETGELEQKSTFVFEKQYKTNEFLAFFNDKCGALHNWQEIERQLNRFLV